MIWGKNWVASDKGFILLRPAQSYQQYALYRYLHICEKNLGAKYRTEENINKIFSHLLENIFKICFHQNDIIEIVIGQRRSSRVKHVFLQVSAKAW